MRTAYGDLSALFSTAACGRVLCYKFGRAEIPLSSPSKGALSFYLSWKKLLWPISLTPVLSKAFGHFASGWVMDFARDTIDPNQFGSVPRSSTMHALVELIHRWQQTLDTQNPPVRLLVMDFSKGFDRVDHIILLKKICNLFLPNFLDKWLSSFLCQRQQRVKLGSKGSGWNTISMQPGCRRVPYWALLVSSRTLRTCRPSAVQSSM